MGKALWQKYGVLYNYHYTTSTITMCRRIKINLTPECNPIEGTVSFVVPDFLHNNFALATTKYFQKRKNAVTKYYRFYRGWKFVLSTLPA